MQYDFNIVASVAVTIVFGGGILGVFLTKKPGWGYFTSGTLILILVLYGAILITLCNQMETKTLANVLFAIAGYAGGLFTAKGRGWTQDENSSTKDKEDKDGRP